MIQHFKKYRELADKFGLRVDVVQTICDSQFEFARNIVAEGKDEKISLTFLGKFYVKPETRENLRKREEHVKKMMDERRLKDKQKK